MTVMSVVILIVTFAAAVLSLQLGAAIGARSLGWK